MANEDVTGRRRCKHGFHVACVWCVVEQIGSPLPGLGFQQELENLHVRLMIATGELAAMTNEKNAADARYMDALVQLGTAQKEVAEARAALADLHKAHAEKLVAGLPYEVVLETAAPVGDPMTDLDVGGES